MFYLLTYLLTTVLNSFNVCPIPVHIGNHINTNHISVQKSTFSKCI